MRFLREAILTVVVPSALLVVTYILFGNNASEYTVAGFVEQFGSGIQKYRVVGPAAVEYLYGLLDHWSISIPIDVGRSPPRLFAAYLCVVGAGFAGFGLLLRRVLREWLDRDATAEYLALSLLVASTFFIATPHDTLSYTAILGGIYAFHGRGTSSRWLFVAVMVAGTLVRESQALVLAYGFAYAVLAPNGSGAWRRLAVGVGAFLAGYVGVRLVVGPSSTLLFEQVELVQNATTPAHWAGLCIAILWLWVTYRIAPKPESSRELPAQLALVASSPYLLAVLTVGRWVEVRLIVPVVLAVFALYVRLDAENIEEPKLQLP